MCACVCLRDPVSGHAMFKELFVKVRHLALGMGVAWPCYLTHSFTQLAKVMGARPNKRLKGKIQSLKASKGFETTKLNWFNVAQLASHTRAPKVLRRPPSEPIRLGSYFVGYGADSLACPDLCMQYKVAFVAERASVKDTLRRALE